MRKSLAVLAMVWGLAALTPAVRAQGVRFDSSVLTAATNVPPGAQAPLFTFPGSVVTVCAYPASGDPCTNAVPVYVDSALTMAGQNPMTADGQGKFGFWIAAGTYSYSVVSPSGRLLGTYAFSAGGSGSGGSGTVTSIAAANANGFTWTITNPAVSPLLSLNTDTTHFLPTNTGSATQYWTGAGTLATPTGIGVSSVGLIMPTSLFSVTSSPLTAAGTITVGLANQMSTCFFASPTGGGTPSCRGIVGTDLPAATNTTFGAIKPDNTSCTVTAGVLTCAGGGSGGTPFGGYASGAPKVPCATSIATSAPCTPAQLGAAGSLVSAPTGSQGIAMPGGSSFALSQTNTTQANPVVLPTTLNCVGPGYDYGNGPTSAVGWANCKVGAETVLVGNSSIAQSHSVVWTKTGTGDGAALAYVYSAAYGGFVDASGEQITPLVIHMDQLGWYTGTLSNGGSGYVGTGGNVPSGATTITPYPVPYSGTVQTVTVAITGGYDGPSAGQAIKFSVQHPVGGGAYMATASQTVSLAATTAPQTFTVSLPALAGDLLASYTTGEGPTEGNDSQIYYGDTAVGTTNTFIPETGGVAFSYSLQPVGTGATSIILNSFACQGCTNNPRSGDLLPDGGIVFDTQTSTVNTITGAGAAMGVNFYTVSGATVPTSTAWGIIIPSSCTHYGGQWKIYASQTCTVTISTSPGSPGQFAASSTHACLVGPWYEEVQITAVATGPEGGEQNITFNSYQSWDGTQSTLIMQGGVCGKGFVATSTIGSWPVGYQEIGFDGANLYYALCHGGACNIIAPDGITAGTSITSYPMAMVTGTLNGLPGGAQLATNSIPFAVGDAIESAPSSSYFGTGFNLYTSQHVHGSNGVRVVDNGPVGLDAAYTAINTGNLSPYAFYTSGNYGSEFFVNQRPTAGSGGLLFVQGNTYDGVHAYNIFADNANGGVTGTGGSFSFDPTTGTFGLTGNVELSGLPSVGCLGTDESGHLGAGSGCSGSATLAGDVTGPAGSNTVAAVHATSGTLNGITQLGFTGSPNIAGIGTLYAAQADFTGEIQVGNGGQSNAVATIETANRSLSFTTNDQYGYIAATWSGDSLRWTAPSGSVYGAMFASGDFTWGGNSDCGTTFGLYNGTSCSVTANASTGNIVAAGSVTSASYVGPATAPTGTCTTVGAWVFSQDGHATFCASGTWTTKI